MSAQKNLTESQCIDLIKFVCDELTLKNTESAVSTIVDKFREIFGVDCACIREIISRPFSFRYTYESTYAPMEVTMINTTVTFDEDVWNSALEKFSEGCYIYKADGTQKYPQFIDPVPVTPVCMIQVPMYSGSDFLGILDLVNFEEIRDWNDREITTLTVCANFISHYLYKLNSSFMELHSNNDIDPLTGLMTFHAFSAKLDEKLSEMLNDAVVAVVYTDINHFKYINEIYGYKRGDELLKLVAQTISGGFTKGTDVLICRAHVDHFLSARAVLKKDLAAFDDLVHQKNENILKLLREICPDVRMRINTGVCYVIDPNTTAASAIAYANLARKTAKSEHMTKPLVFSDEMMEEMKYQEYLNNELPKAIKNRDLKVYYQPKINCTDDTLYGAEALVRWQKPDRSFIYPDQFIPVFEKNGNIVDVDFYVYKEVFRYIRGRLDAGLPVFPISMNVSRVHFRSERIIPYIEGLMKEYNMPPELVEFELTENIYMNNFSRADKFIKSCREHNIQVSMDDFGSGYSSLNVISTLSIDTLKIDKIFLKNDNLSVNDKTVIESMIAMAKRLGMKVVCEGVETESQMTFLKNAKCDQIQGYYYGKPMDEETFNKFVAELISKSSAQ